MALLHEVTQHRHGAGSKWGPFWTHRDAASGVVSGAGAGRDLQAAELLKIEEEEVQSEFRWVSSNVCKSDNTGICNRRSDPGARWDLHPAGLPVGACRGEAERSPVRLETTGKEYLSLFPREPRVPRSGRWRRAGAAEQHCDSPRRHRRAGLPPNQDSKETSRMRNSS